MPYPRLLQQYTLPEFYQEAPAAWVTRLREISPETSNLEHLVFRFFAPREDWYHPERGMWALYTAKPIRLVDRERAEQFVLHWSELPTEFQSGRKAIVSDYQHFMWHARGLYVKPFMLLQGEWGGTPAKYTPSEQAFLEASDCISTPFPPGFFPACPFDERTVKQIALRDRLLQQSNNYDALEKLDTPEAMKREDDAAARLKRETYLDTWKVMIQPSVEFMQSFLKTKEATRVLPDAPDGLGNAVAQWKDHWVEHGSVIGARVASQRTRAVAVA